MRSNLIAFVVITLLSLGFSSAADAQDYRWSHGTRRNYSVYAPDTAYSNHHDCDDEYYCCYRHSRKYYRHKYWAERYYHEHRYNEKYHRYHRYYDRWDNDRYYYRGGGY